MTDWVATAGLRFVQRAEPVSGPAGVVRQVRILQQQHVEQRDPQTNWVNPPETKWFDVPLVEDEE
jgi:hypothetical protein